MDNTKREFIVTLLNNSIDRVKEQLTAVGIDSDVFDSIDKEIMVNNMEEACKLSGEELLEVDTFLSSDKYKKYEESIFAMSDVIFKVATNELQVGGKEHTIH